MQSEKFKVTPLERSWILYDVGNSAFVLMIATLVPIFFNALAEAGGLSPVNYLAYWGYASSVVTVITAVLGPILGTLADTRGFKKPIFMLCLFVGVAGCCAMGLATTWMPFLIIFILAKIGFSGSLVFYDSMLGDVTTPERMDVVSSQGYAWGYIGSCVPFVVCLALVLGSGAIGLSQMTALSVALLITAVWWLGTTLPLLRNYKQINYVEVEQHAIRQSFVRIGHTLKHLYEDKQVFWFLLAFFCYIDGVYTIIDMATAYGTALGLDTTGLLLALLVTQIVAFPSALIFGRLSAKYPSSQLIPVCIATYLRPELVLCHPSQRVSRLATRVSMRPLVSSQHFMRVRSVLQNIICLVSFSFSDFDHFLTNSLQSLNETIQLFFRLAFRRLYHQCPVNGERQSGSMETEVHQTLGNIQLGDSIFFIEHIAIPDHLVTYTTFRSLEQNLEAQFLEG